MLNAKISGIASYLPTDILDNEMLSKMVDTNDEWITTRVGIKERRILKKDVGSSYMGIEAVNKLLADYNVDPADIDLLICATSNPDYRFPSTGSIICEGVGLKNAYAYDIQAACAGFIVALEDAAAYVKSGLRKKVVVVATEKMSSMVNYNDRATCPLFGDGAPACSWSLQRKRASACVTRCSMWTAAASSILLCGPAVRPSLPLRPHSMPASISCSRTAATCIRTL